MMVYSVKVYYYSWRKSERKVSVCSHVFSTKEKAETWCKKYEHFMEGPSGWIFDNSDPTMDPQFSIGTINLDQDILPL